MPPTNLDAVLATADLFRRPYRAPDYRAESEALRTLMEASAAAPSKVLRVLVEEAMSRCGATSAGLSVDEVDADGHRVFRWQATAGNFDYLLNTTLPYDASPCGYVVQSRASQLMRNLALAFPRAEGIEPPIREVLLAPFFIGGQPLGTIWVVDHGDSRPFDLEDKRILESLADFAAIAWRGYCEAQELLQGQERFRMVFDQAADDAIVMFDAERVITAWNPTAARITGWRAAEAIGHPAAMLLVPDEHGKNERLEQMAIATRDGKASDEGWHFRKDGSRFWGIGTVNALHDADGKVVGYLKVFRDATKRHEEAQMLAFLSRLTDAIIRQRAEGDVILTCERMLGEFLDVSRVTFSLANPEGTQVTVREEWRRNVPSIVGTHTVADFGAQLAEDFRVGRVHVSRDAELDYLPGAGLEAVRAVGARSGLSVPLLREGKLAALLVVHHREPRNWTEAEIALTRQTADRMLIEAERARTEERLESMVAERTSELRSAVKEAESFNYSIAHDLRAPLRAIISTSNILLAEASENLSPEHLAMLGRQAHNSARLGRLIDELLQLSRLARAEIVRQPLDMTALARDAAARFDACAIEVQEGMVARGDPTYVQNVLAALLDNASKFSPEGGPVVVGHDGEAFFVRDRGIGFDMAYAAKVFLPFERLVTETQFPGTGIGLAIVKRIVDRHGGRVWAEGIPGTGSTFYFTLTG